MDFLKNHSDYLQSYAIKSLYDKIKHPLVIVCNGPSMRTIEYDRVPEDPVLFRLNWFFLEEDYYFGRHVDAYFWSIYNDILQDTLYLIIKKRLYHLDTFFCPMPLIESNRKKRREPDQLHHDFFQPRFDHWKIISFVPELSRIMMSRPMPTTGLQALATGLILGFREIHIIGMDFYQSSKNRYAYNIPSFVTNRMSSVHFSPGYEKNSHSLEIDLRTWDIINKCFPDSKIYSLSSDSYLAKLIDKSPRLDNKNNLFLRKQWESGSPPYVRKHRSVSNYLKNLLKKRLSNS
jgi:Alpha-2,3-sialyltransferase (CST-I)